MKEIARKTVMILLVVILLGIMGSFWWFVGTNAAKEKAEEEALAITAMYVEVGYHGDYMFVQQETDTPFIAEIPDSHVYELRDGKEWKIDRDALVSGDILKFYGDGAMTLSYPGQYPGVSRVVRIRRGEPEDTEKYQEMLEELRPQPIYDEELGIIAPQ